MDYINVVFDRHSLYLLEGEGEGVFGRGAGSRGRAGVVLLLPVFP